MGTTLTAVVVEGELARFVHVGDSRAYLLRDGRLEQLSMDHSLVGEMVREGTLTREEAAAHPQRSILSRVLGTEAGAQLDEFAAELRRSDVLLLCSDGLSGEVPDDVLRDLLVAADPDEAARDLIAAARAAGGHDNITAVVIRVEASDEAAPGDEGDTAGPRERRGHLPGRRRRSGGRRRPGRDRRGWRRRGAGRPPRRKRRHDRVAARGGAVRTPPSGAARRRPRPRRPPRRGGGRRRQHVLLRRRRRRTARRVLRSSVGPRARSS